MREAMDKVKAALGPHAVVLQSRELRGGPDGLVEIAAAIDAEPDHGRLTEDALPVAAHHGSDFMPDPETLNGVRGEISALRREISKMRAERVLSAPPATVRWEQLMDELKELARSLGISADPAVAEDAIVARLIGGGVEASLARTLVGQASGWSGEGAQGQRLRAVSDRIRSALEPAPALWDRPTRTIAALVGPTGVGKTTTLAKIAAHTALRQGRSVGIIATDTYRIGAVEQVKTYAELIGVPFTVARNTAEVGRAIDRFKDADLVLVDTTGRNPWRDDTYGELEAVIGGLPIERHLCVSATSSGADIGRIVERYTQGGLRAVVVTKLDEARKLGGMLSAVIGTGHQIAHVTTGQDVPGDIETPDADRLCRHVFG